LGLTHKLILIDIAENKTFDCICHKTLFASRRSGGVAIPCGRFGHLILGCAAGKVGDAFPPLSATQQILEREK